MSPGTTAPGELASFPTSVKVIMGSLGEKCSEAAGMVPRAAYAPERWMGFSVICRIIQR
jgi:hypothetical protein